MDNLANIGWDWLDTPLTISVKDTVTPPPTHEQVLRCIINCDGNVINPTVPFGYRVAEPAVTPMKFAMFTNGYVKNTVETGKLCEFVKNQPNPVTGQTIEGRAIKLIKNEEEINLLEDPQLKGLFEEYKNDICNEFSNIGL